MSVNCCQTLSTKAFHPKKLKTGLAIMIGAGLDRNNFTNLHCLWDPIDCRPRRYGNRHAVFMRSLPRP